VTAVEPAMRVVFLAIPVFYWYVTGVFVMEAGLAALMTTLRGQGYPLNLLGRQDIVLLVGAVVRADYGAAVMLGIWALCPHLGMRLNSNSTLSFSTTASEVHHVAWAKRLARMPEEVVSRYLCRTGTRT